jgi:hypothetical protein
MFTLLLHKENLQLAGTQHGAEWTGMSRAWLALCVHPHGLQWTPHQADSDGQAFHGSSCGVSDRCFSASMSPDGPVVS